MAEKKIGGYEYRVSKVSATDGVKMLARITKLLGPAMRYLQGAISTLGKEDPTPEQRAASDNAMIAAFAAILDGASEDDLVRFLTETAERAEIKVEGAYDKVQFDTHFENDLMAAFQVAAFVVEVQFGSFFAAARSNSSLNRILRPAMPSA